MKNITQLLLLIILISSSCKEDKEIIQMTEEQSFEVMKTISETEWGGIKNEMLEALDLYESLVECGVNGDSSGLVINYENVNDSISYNKDYDYNWALDPCEDPSQRSFSSTISSNKNWDFSSPQFSFSYPVPDMVIRIYDNDESFYFITCFTARTGVYENDLFSQNIILSSNCGVRVNKGTYTFQLDSDCTAKVSFPADQEISYSQNISLN